MRNKRRKKNKRFVIISERRRSVIDALNVVEAAKLFCKRFPNEFIKEIRNKEKVPKLF